MPKHSSLRISSREGCKSMAENQKSLGSKDLWTISSAFFFIFMGVGAFQQFLIPVFSVKLGRSAMECSWILATLYLSFLFWRVVCGWTLKWLGDYLSLVLSSLTYLGFAICALFVNNYSFLIIAAIVWGWGAASIWIAASTQVLDTSTRTKYGSASGIFYTATQLGQAIGVFLLGWIAGKQGNKPMLIWAIIITAVGNMIIFGVPKRRTRRESPTISRIFGVLKSRKSKIIAFMQFVSSFGFGIVMSSFGDLIKTLYGVALIGIITQGFYVTRMVCGYFAGWLSDRVGRDTVLILGFLFSAIGLGLAIFVRTPWALFISAATFGLQVGTVPIVVMAMIGDSTTPERRHLVFGAIYLWRDLGVAVSILTGMYLNAYTRNFTVGFGVFAILFLICMVFSFNLRRYREEDF